MKIQIYRIILLMTFAILVSGIAKGLPEKDSLIQYLEIAGKNNPLVLQKYNEYEASLQKVFQVGSLPDPELNAGIFLKPMELMDGLQVADLKIMQMFPWFGVIKNAKDEMNLMAKAKFELFRDAKLQVNFDVLKTWNELNNVQQNIRISQKNIKILETIERLALIKFKSASAVTGNVQQSGGSVSVGNPQSNSSGSGGMLSMGNSSADNSSATANSGSSRMQGSSMGSSSGESGLADLYRIQIEKGDLENNIELLKSRQNSIVARFNSYLNRPVSSPVSISDTLIQVSPPAQIIRDYDNVVMNNPMLTMLKYEEQSFEAREKMSKAMGYPMVGIGVNYTIINKSEMSTSPMNGKNMVMPMLSVTLPVYRKKYRAMQNEAALLSSAARENYQAVINSLQTEYFEAVQTLMDAQRRLKLYSNQSMLTKKSLDIMIKNFSSSGSSLTDVLRIRQQLLDYESKEAEAIKDFNISVAMVNRLTATAQIQ
jgi:outer membrane protein TolC